MNTLSTWGSRERSLESHARKERQVRDVGKERRALFFGVGGGGEIKALSLFPPSPPPPPFGFAAHSRALSPLEVEMNQYSPVSIEA